MFGDPQESSPKIKFRLGASALSSTESTAVLGALDAQVGLPDVVDGRFFGGFAGVAVRAGEIGLFVTGVSLGVPVEVRFSSFLHPH